MATKKTTTKKKETSIGISTIYGIFLKNKCLYIGSTDRNIEDRWKEHQKDLEKGKHTNSTLQKQYNENNNFEYRVLMQLPTDNTLIKFLTESLVNSIHKPSCCKCIIAQGRMRVILQRCEPKLAEKILDCIKEYFK